MRKDTRIKLYETMYVTTRLYGSEPWVLIKRQHVVCRRWGKMFLKYKATEQLASLNILEMSQP